MKKTFWFMIPIFFLFFVPSFGLGAQHTPTNSISTSQEQAFFKAAKDLYDAMLDDHNSALQVALKAECDSSQIYQSSMPLQVVAQHYKTWISLATQMIDHVPFMARLKSLPLYEQIRGFEALHVLAMVRAKIIEVSCRNALKHGVPPPKPLEAQKLLEVLQQNLEFIYPFLINASKQGLPLKSFLHTLHWTSILTFSACEYQSTLLSQLHFSSKEDSAKLKELKDILAKDSSPTILRFKTLRAGLDNFLLDSFDYDFPRTESIAYNEQLIENFYQQVQETLGLSLQDIHRWRDYYAYRFNTWLYSVRALSASQPLATPDLFACFNASKEDIPACQVLLKHPNAYFYRYFRHTRLISFNDQLCLYLTPQNTLQTFPSKDPLCQTLQANPPQMGMIVPSNLIKAFQEAQDTLMYMLDTPPHDPKPFKKRLKAILQATPLASLRGAKWHHLLEYEQVHLLALLRGSIKDSDLNIYKHHAAFTPIPVLAYHYLHLLNFFYTPLIEATKQGLSPSVYLKDLKKSARSATNPCAQKNLCKPPKNIGESPWLEDFKTAKLGSYLISDEGSSSPYVPFVWWSAISRTHKQGETSPNKGLALRWTPKQAPLWDLHYKRRIKAFFTNKDFYTDTLLHPEKISADRLRANPTSCFTPKYLNQQSVQNCQLILEKQRFDESKIRDYLESMRLLSVDGSPCLYLHGKEQLRGFNSKNPLCQALQTRPPNFSPPSHISKRTLVNR
ncbi:glycoside hydrolase [Helicobacter salomonis]|uniref:glycoside hydrolase n=1 Tax=Helicobacter salomonis TaxID=56878 RepID=UPI000CF0839C|nr:glycoside hydrolase [Helicobacter salomonis]